MTELDKSDEVHVYPLFGPEHIIDYDIECWCHPERDKDSPNIVVHKTAQ